MSRPNKRPESVLVVVYTQTGEVLLLRRLVPSDFWQSVTGSMEWDENNPLATAYRELQEEIGLQDVTIVDCQTTNRFPIKPEWRRRYDPSVQENTEYVFRLALPTRVSVRLDPHEHTEYLWLPRDEAAAKASSYTNRDAILAWVPPYSGRNECYDTRLF